MSSFFLHFFSNCGKVGVMTELESIRQRLDGLDTNELRVIAKRCRGLPWQTLYKIASGLTLNPKIETIERIRKALR